MAPFAETLATLIRPSPAHAALVVLLAVALDAVAGDPPTPVHPVAWLGRLIAALETGLRRVCGRRERLAGVALATITVAVAVAGALGVSAVARAVHPLAGLAADTLLVWSTLAARSLAEEGRAIGLLLGRADLEGARARLAGVVARRTDVLDEVGVARSAIESLGENVVDAVIAPLLWAALLGPAGAWLHKSASTLDSMVGYRTPRHERIGAASARLDDALAWIPARLALVLVPAAAGLIGLDAAGAWRIGLADRRKHESPNSAHGEAVFAGALGVELGGRATYADRVSERPRIGQGLAAPSARSCLLAARLVIASAVLTGAACALALVAVGALAG